jgi:hypothetical protein
MDIQQQLDTIERKRQELLTQTPDEKNTELIKKAYDEYISAKEINKFAPSQLDQAETNYYKARYGIDYLDRQKEKYKIESAEMTKEKLQAHEAQLEKVDETLNNYKNSEKYSKKINKVKAIHLARIKEYIQKIRLSQVDTNQQLAFFKSQEEDVLCWYIVLLNWFISLFTVYFIFNNRRSITKKTIIQAIFLITIVFFVKHILFIVDKLFHVQLKFGYDPMKSKLPWVLYAISILVAIWLWVYLDIFTKLSRGRFTPVPPPINPPAPGAPAVAAAPTTSIFGGISVPVGVAIGVIITVIVVVLLLLLL